MSNKPATLLIALSFLVTACTATGPADDGFDNSHESIDIGSVYSDTSGGYVIYSSDDDSDTKTEKTDPANASDFEAYQQWLQAKEKKSPEYQKFQKWQEFEEFQRWKQLQQKTD